MAQPSSPSQAIVVMDLRRGESLAPGLTGSLLISRSVKKTFGFCSLCPIFSGLNRMKPSVPPKSISPREVL